MDHFYRDNSLFGRLGQSHFLGSCSDAHYGIFLLRFRTIRRRRKFSVVLWWKGSGNATDFCKTKSTKVAGKIRRAIHKFIILLDHLFAEVGVRRLVSTQSAVPNVISPQGNPAGSPSGLFGFGPTIGLFASDHPVSKSLLYYFPVIFD